MKNYTLHFDYYGLSIKLENDKVNIRHKTSIDSISVDSGRDITYICLNGLTNGYPYARVIEVKGWHFEVLANLIHDLIKLKKPNKLYLSKFGMDLGVRNYLEPKLTKDEIILSESGVLIY